MFVRRLFYVAFVVLCLPPFFYGSRAQAQVNVYLSSPNRTSIQTFTGVRLATEAFDGTAQKYMSDYSSAAPSATGTASTTVGHGGTYTLNTVSSFVIQANDDYGANMGQYMAFGAQSGTSGAITLSFDRKLSYFGMSWNAGDANNRVSFYNGTTLVGHYLTSNIITSLSASTVTTVDGNTIYNTSRYKGRPTGGGTTGTAPSVNTAEPYAYLNFFASNASSVFDHVVFSNSGTTGTGFETDNHTVVAANSLAQPTVSRSSFVSVGTTVMPEPGSVALVFPILVGSGVYLRRGRKNSGKKPLTSK